jgi:hypothetical protein
MATGPTRSATMAAALRTEPSISTSEHASGIDGAAVSHWAVTTLSAAPRQDASRATSVRAR